MQTNAQFSKNPLFQRACQIAGIPATSRQASKWRQGRGLARFCKSKAIKEMKAERR